jgi:hypothetical protein
MITFAEIETELEKAGASHELSRSVARALELSQRKTASEVETNLKEWMENRFVTKEEFGDFRTEMLKWMFIFWSSQLLAIAGMLFGFVKLLRP